MDEDDEEMTDSCLITDDEGESEGTVVTWQCGKAQNINLYRGSLIQWFILFVKRLRTDLVFAALKGTFKFLLTLQSNT